MKIIIALFSLNSLCIAQNIDYTSYNYHKVDSFAKQLDSKGNVEKLAKQLTDRFNEKHVKVRAIFTWVSHHISYDCEALKNESLITTDPNKILKQEKAVCSGYSSLFKELCNSINIKCQIIDGFARNGSEDIGVKLKGEGDHAWNAVFTENEWHLIDVTWAAGYSSPGDCDFEKNFNEFYFYCNPELFKYNHYPLDENKLFISTNWSKEDFSNYPLIYSDALVRGISLISPESGTLTFFVGDTLKLSFRSEKRVRYIEVSYDKEDYSDVIRFNNDNDIYTTNYRITSDYPFEKIGKSYYTVYINREAALTYYIEVKAR